ncbi:DUF2510 domain-containing protein [Sanguibacter antarcticus]|uniref:Uncharacterized protein DUF2510 n=1 Tax=Sanguibacter antarcticus TaxID=372484 RepID=A0A2A9E748_9MICO|nr:DUF2510 domain-containing protein [Sanguibacter antarcticus]PFG34466.1 uncharacterized protein DUF2510 [Sanguibacter antarcticus]
MSAPAGWYTDPQDSQVLRYFDGASWTTHTQPVPAAPASGQYGQQGQFQQGQYGQQSQPQQGWQQGPSPLASQFTAQQRQPAWGTGASSGGRGGTPTGVKLAIAGALVGIVVFMGVGLALSGNSTSEADPDELSDALSAVVDDGFDCEALGEQAVLLSEPDEVPLVSTSNLTMTKDLRSTVEVPESGRTVALACRGDSEWGDGSRESVDLELSLDSAGDAWVSYSVR